ncbi:MAG: hypothetical protein KKG04_00430, partial [Candidatus Thermoplasmatota archaeon]|nr:hypothetical protein [Candidatus Thermoplasmatota archaeon]
MSFENRLHKNIEKLEKNIEKEKSKIAVLHQKCDNKQITKADFTIKKKRIEEKIHAMNSRIRVLQGGLTREKKHQEEKTEKKQKKKKE